jgi:3-hydroxyisobutyrate dehydrogenase
MAEPLELAGPVGFIGLGIMGSAMSTHLLEAGHRVIGYDVSPAACDAHRARGGTVAGSPAEIAARTSLVVTSLPSAGALTKVLRGPDGLAARAALGLTVIETSTLAPEDKEAERQFLADRQAWLLDCRAGAGQGPRGLPERGRGGQGPGLASAGRHDPRDLRRGRVR